MIMCFNSVHVSTHVICPLNQACSERVCVFIHFLSYTDDLHETSAFVWNDPY